MGSLAGGLAGLRVGCWEAWEVNGVGESSGCFEEMGTLAEA